MPCFLFVAAINFSIDILLEFTDFVMSLFGNDSDGFGFTGNVNAPTYAAALAIEAVAGLVANFTVLAITLYQRNSFKQSSTIFFTSLLLANLIMVIYILITSITIGTEEWIVGSTHEEKTATCAFFAYMSWNSYMTMSMTIAAISFDRFLFIVKPHLHKSFMKPQVALFVTIGIWLLSGVINTTPFYGLGEYGYASYFGLCSSLLDRKGLCRANLK
ncbi:PREDICTED: melanopsin-like [Amphimedon queenslandica]|uniref:G-protein coupled receptors family 1 profile domain-containing protein n=1 Tax=Amphimedon queenslandica TaxID=400682 RepID=A0AAN0JAI8_AMPQE|nr:PREDICTED: melanopsin-like [Amphimedon queenslandica]|eukprot:XP_019853767.1 PREDICTED: melanopsin-like [Amphimedon queenslandica]